MIIPHTAGEENPSEDQTKPNIVDDQGKPFSRKVASADACYNIVRKIKRDNEATFAFNAKLIGMHNGRAPFVVQDQERQNMSWVPNVNTRQAESIIDSNTSSVWDMFCNVPSLIVLQTIEPSDSTEVSRYADIIADEFTKIIKRWQDFHYNTMLRISEMLKMGCGPVLWEDPWDWRSCAINNGKLLLPKRTKSTIGGVDICVVLGEIDPSEILDKMELSGWNKDACKRALIRAYRGGSQKRGENINDFEKIEQRIKNRDYDDTTDFDGLKVYHVFVTELSGKVSHYILPIDEESTKKKRAYIYENDEKYESMSKALHLMLFNIGDGYYYSVRGLLGRIYHFCDLSNRMFCGMITGAMISSSVMLQMQSDQLEKSPLIHIGGMTIIPRDLQPIQSNFQPNLNNLSSVYGLMQRMQNNNTGVYRSEDETTTGVKTAKQAELEAVSEARFESHQSAWYYVQWEAWLHETFRRLINNEYPSSAGGYEEHKRFMENCDKRGVPKEWMDFDKWTVSAYRSVGMGSPTMRIQIVDKMLKTVGLLDERGRSEVVREWYAAHAQWANVDRFVTLLSRDKIRGQSHAIAESENVDMSQGFAREINADDPDKIHLDTHLIDVANDITKFKENPSVAESLANVMKLKVQHIVAHIKKLSVDPSRKAQAKNYGKVVAQISKVLATVMKTSESIQESRQNQQQSMMEQVQKMQQQLDERNFEMKKYEIDKNAELQKYEIELNNKNKLLELESLNTSRESKTRVANVTKISTASAKIAAESVKAKRKS